MATAALVLGGVGLLSLGCLWIFSAIFAVIGLILSFLALKDTNPQNVNAKGGRQLAWIGLGLNIATLVIALVITLAFVIALATSS